MKFFMFFLFSWFSDFGIILVEHREAAKSQLFPTKFDVIALI